jgi:hypothetical protein
MQLLDEETMYVLRIVDYAERMGEPLSTEEFGGFAQGARRRTSTTRPAFALMGETTTTEGVLDYIMRLKFVTLDGRGARMTRLGRIVVANSAEIEDEADQPKEILLAAADEWVLRDIIRTVRNSGECLIVDPYCREPQLNELVRYTPVTRVLVGPVVAGEGFDLTLGRVRPPRTLEVRVSDAIHDRHVIPDSGPVLAFGMSLNGIGGKKPTIVVTLSADLSRAVRDTYNELSKTAVPWAPPVEAEPKTDPPEG